MNFTNYTLKNVSIQDKEFYNCVFTKDSMNIWFKDKAIERLLILNIIVFALYSIYMFFIPKVIKTLSINENKFSVKIFTLLNVLIYVLIESVYFFSVVLLLLNSLNPYSVLWLGIFLITIIYSVFMMGKISYEVLK